MSGAASRRSPVGRAAHRGTTLRLGQRPAVVRRTSRSAPGDQPLGELSILLGDFGCTGGTPMLPCPGDLNGDGFTDRVDLGILRADFGCTP